MGGQLPSLEPHPSCVFLGAGALTGPYEGLEAEECGILDGCAHGRCVRVPEGFTCDCFDGYRLDMTRMSCVGEAPVESACEGMVGLGSGGTIKSFSGS